MGFADQNRAAAAAMGRSYGNPPGFAGTLSPEQRARMLAVLSPAQRTAYDAMTAAQKTTFESDYADAHWDVISGTSTTAAQAQQTQSYLGLTEQALGLTFGTISTAMANNNQQVLAQIRSDGDARIATIQAQLTRDLAPTEAVRLRNELTNLQHTQDLLDTQRNQTAQTFTYIGAAAAVIVAIGGYLWWSQSQSRHNPVVERSNHRVFIPMDLLGPAEQRRERAKLHR